MGGLIWILAACTTDPVPDEDFEIPTTNFPLLGNVPDRPVLPPPEETARQKKRLQQEHDQATEERQEVVKSLDTVIKG